MRLISDGLMVCYCTCNVGCLSFTLICYLVGNAIFSDYLYIQFIPGVGEISVFCGSIVGSCLGFLWYNTSAKIFMGDTGSLSLGVL